MKTATVTIRFEERQNAELFATKWGRASKRGHIIGAGLKNVEVTLHDVTPTELDWVKQEIND